MTCAKCEWIVSPLDDKARRADHFGRSIERASAHRPNGGLGGAGPYAAFCKTRCTTEVPTPTVRPIL